MVRLMKHRRRKKKFLMIKKLLMIFRWALSVLHKRPLNTWQKTAVVVEESSYILLPYQVTENYSISVVELEIQNLHGNGCEKIQITCPKCFIFRFQG